jgi:membrane-associated protease RseP (regulator of RpoE activity)
MDGMFRAQCTWDATMAYHAVRALTESNPPDPADVVVVLLGSGHVAFGLGAPRQARQWFSGTMATVIPMPIIDDEGDKTKVRASVADYIWGLPPDPPSSPYPALGVTLAERKDIPHPVIATVSAGSPAAVAGLQAEDRLVSFDGVPVADKETFLQVMGGKRWGDGAALVLERGGQTVSVTAALRRKTR